MVLYTGGETLTYQLTIFNHGPGTLTGIDLVDDLTSVFGIHATGVSASCQVSGDANNSAIGNYSISSTGLFVLTGGKLSNNSEIVCILTYHQRQQY